MERDQIGLTTACFLDGLFSKKVMPPVLYHYSDVNALKGIVDNKELWATHWNYLNDKNEFRGALDILKECINQRLKDETISSVMKDYLKNQRNWLKDEFLDDYHTGLCSFSEEGDLLSQWRGYGKKYKSVSIGFDTSKIQCSRNSKEGLQLFFWKVVYDDEEKKKIFNLLLNHINSLSFTNSAYVFFHVCLCQLLLCCKEKCWGEEKEWRLILLPTGNYEMGFRQNEYGLIPYYKLKCFKENKAVNPTAKNEAVDAIKKIILPKSEYFDKAKKALCLYNKDLESKILQSEISITY